MRPSAVVASASHTLGKFADFVFRLFPSKYTRDAAHDAAHGQFTFAVCEKDLANPGPAVVPALEQSEMLHGFQRSSCFRGREGIQSCPYPRLHRLRLCVLGRLNAERNRPADSSGVNPEECDRTCEVTRLNHKRGEPVEPPHNSRELADDGLQFFHARVNRCGVFKRKCR